MTKQIEAIYENGVLRPVHPINIPEGEHLKLIVITHQKEKNGNAAASLAEIAALPYRRRSGCIFLAIKLGLYERSYLQ